MSCNITPIPSLNVGYCELKDKVNEVVAGVNANCNNLALITSGEYTPSFTAGDNVISVTNGKGYWQRIGDYVFCNIVADIDGSGTGGTFRQFTFSLPIAPTNNFSGTKELFGSGVVLGLSDYYVSDISSINGTKNGFHISNTQSTAFTGIVRFQFSYKI